MRDFYYIGQVKLLLNRYATQENGKSRKIAAIYTAEEHGIIRSCIDRDAVSIINRLSRHGFEGYIVGGAVRDLMLDTTPKDYDIVTDAHPRQIRKLFRNSRIIGRRFRLVHIFFGQKIFEVATFRTDDPDASNVFGTMEEDVRRRDFTANSLYYDPKKEYVIDFKNGVYDIRRKNLRCIIPVKEIFRDDPVRMIRAVKYATRSGLTMERKLKNQIRRDSDCLAACSRSRMTEEVFKVLQSGQARAMVEAFELFELFPHMLPRIAELIRRDADKRKIFLESLSELDVYVTNEENSERGMILHLLTRDFLLTPDTALSPEERFQEMYGNLKAVLFPITPPNVDVEKAVTAICRERNIAVRKKKKRRNYSRSKLDRKKPRRTPPKP